MNQAVRGEGPLPAAGTSGELTARHDGESGITKQRGRHQPARRTAVAAGD
jgi:hypothetical protein